jgi:hypothetical protein
VAKHVHGDIDQDIDLIASNDLGQGRVVQSADFSPNIRAAANPRSL